MLSLALPQFPIRLVLNSEASNQIEWHCKHYVGRGLMKRFDSGDALAKEIGIKPEALKATCKCPFSIVYWFSAEVYIVDKYNEGAKAKNDPFGKKVVHGSWMLLELLIEILYSSSNLVTYG